MNDDGLKYIVDSIKFNTTITKIELERIIIFNSIDNSLREKSIIYLNELFKYNKTITHLDINSIIFNNF
jgi:hypothetical protein